jgi:hypothetical protein
LEILFQVIPYLLGGAALYTLGYMLYRTIKKVPPNVVVSSVGVKHMPEIINLIPEDEWAIVESNGVQYRVHPRALGPFTIGDAFRIAADNHWEVPTPELADAIWAAADIRVLPNPMRTDGTFKTMMSPETVEANQKLIEEQVAGRTGLVAGDHKDIVQRNGKHGIYGWHVSLDEAGSFSGRTGIPLHDPVTPNLGAKIIQQFPSPHGDDWGDYSQYLYPVKRV